MPYFRHRDTAEVVYADAGSERDQELASDAAWARTTDDEPATAEAEPA
jgi:hypothetical protein